MRTEIEHLVASGRTEREIIDLYKARYGMRILAEPEGTTWWIATLVPAVAILTALLLLAMFLRNYARARVPEVI
jgi:cytochrome c-type biogenesis protein CcmH/NrfF